MRLTYTCNERHLGGQTRWSKVQASPAASTQALNKEFNARPIGAQRQQAFQMHRRTFRGGGFRRR